MASPSLPSGVQTVRKASSRHPGAVEGPLQGRRRSRAEARCPEGGFISAKNLQRRAEESHWSGSPRTGPAHRPQFPVRGAALGAEWSHQKGGFSLPSLQSAAASEEEGERANRYTLTASRGGLALPSQGQGRGSADPQPTGTALPLAGNEPPGSGCLHPRARPCSLLQTPGTAGGEGMVSAPPPHRGRPTGARPGHS